MSTVKLTTSPQEFKPVTLSIALNTQVEVDTFKALAWRSSDDVAACINCSSGRYKVTAAAVRTLLAPINHALNKLE